MLARLPLPHSSCQNVDVEAGLHACADWEPFMAQRGPGQATAPCDPRVTDGLGEGKSRRELTIPGRLAGRRRAWLTYRQGLANTEKACPRLGIAKFAADTRRKNGNRLLLHAV